MAASALPQSLLQLLLSTEVQPLQCSSLKADRTLPAFGSIQCTWSSMEPAYQLVFAFECAQSASPLTQHTEAIIYGDHQYLSIAGQHGAIVGIAAVPLVRLAVHKNQHRILGRTCRRG